MARHSRLARHLVALAAGLTLTLATGLGTAHLVHANSDVWTGAGDGIHWSDANNWGGLAPAPGDSLVFNISATTTDDLGAGFPLSGILFGADSTVNVSGGSSIALSGQIVVNGTNTGVVFNPPVSLAVAGDTINDAASNGGITLNGVISGANDLNFLGPGQTEVTAANTYSGGTTAHLPSQVEMGNGAALGTGTIIVNTGASVTLLTTPMTVANAWTVSGTGFSGAGAILCNGADTLNGTVTLAANAQIDCSIGHSVTFTGGIAGAHALILSGGTMNLPAAGAQSSTVIDSGTLVAASIGSAFGGNPVSVASGGEVDLTGGITVSSSLTLNGSGTTGRFALGSPTGNDTWSGNILLAGDSTVGSLGGGALTLSGVISGSANLTVNGIGFSVITLSGATGNTFTGSTTVIAGVLLLDKTALFATVGAGGLVVGTTATATTVHWLSIDQLPNGVPVMVGSNGALTFGGLGEFTGFDLTVAGGAQVASDGNGGGIVLHSLSNTGTGSAPAVIGSTTGSHGTMSFSVSPAPINVTRTTAAQDVQVNATIGGPTTLQKTGDGILEFSGANFYSGPTQVNGGTLLVDGTQPASAIQVGSGATIGGTGTTGSITSTGGNVAPGDSPGILTSAAVSLDSASSLVAIVNGTTAGTQYSQLNAAAGGVTLGGATLSMTLGYTPAAGDSYTLIRNQANTAISGTFNGLPEGAQFFVGGHPFSITYLGGVGGHDVVVRALATAASSTAVTSSQNPSTVGQSVTFTATVSSGAGGGPTPTGTVVFKDGSTTLGQCTLSAGGCSLATSALTAGSHSITANYSGDAAYAASVSATLTQTVNAAVPVPPTGGGPLRGLLLGGGLLILLGGGLAVVSRRRWSRP